MPKLVERIQKQCHKNNVNVKNVTVENAERKKKQCIAIIHYKCKLSLFGRDNILLAFFPETLK